MNDNLIKIEFPEFIYYLKNSEYLQISRENQEGMYLYGTTCIDISYRDNFILIDMAFCPHNFTIRQYKLSNIHNIYVNETKGYLEFSAAIDDSLYSGYQFRIKCYDIVNRLLK